MEAFFRFHILFSTHTRFFPSFLRLLVIISLLLLTYFWWIRIRVRDYIDVDVRLYALAFVAVRCTVSSEAASCTPANYINIFYML